MNQPSKHRVPLFGYRVASARWTIARTQKTKHPGTDLLRRVSSREQRAARRSRSARPQSTPGNVGASHLPFSVIRSGGSAPISHAARLLRFNLHCSFFPVSFTAHICEAQLTGVASAEKLGISPGGPLPNQADSISDRDLQGENESAHRWYRPLAESGLVLLRVRHS